MKYLKTNLEGKVRNLPHFKGEALLPVFEAVVNSIQAIEERGNLSGGEIEVRVVREAQGMLGDMDESGITGFVITDYGIGFDEANYDSFETSDSIHKQALGGKGVGRFLWLKAFESVEIESVYAAKEQRMKRKFAFTTSDGIKEDQHAETTDEVRTVVRLRGFKKEYQRLPSAYKTTAKIAQRIMEHCLSYFISGEAPRVTVLDQDERLVLNEIFDKDIKNNITLETVQLEGHEFSLVHIKLYSTHEKMHNAVLCANRRDVKALSLAKSLGTSSQFDDVDRRFTYALYVSSAYLDQTVNNYRLDFEIPEDAPLLAEAGVVSMKQIEGAVASAAKIFLQEFLAKARERKEAIVANSSSDERPDIVAFAEVDEDKIARAVSILEFKKPQRTNFDEDPTRQLYRYLREIKNNKKVRLPNGRDLNVGETTRYYCYAICDITPAIDVYAENDGNYARLKGELGYYKYNRTLNAHTEILHFDKIVADAKRRHKAFFEKLGIG